ncbi:MAG: diaminobutyrate acetyltransferase [Candidatus Hydrogenedentes bacterium]|nr:diaminobutyrate acetyltransferase [Candidatus Hydrogenedentota bacterium]
MSIQQTTRKTQDGNALVIRPPSVEDAADIHELIAQCPPLEINSCYTYLLLSTHFRTTCAVALNQKRMAAFLGAYVIPEHKDTLFVWQIAVHTDFRGKGVGQLMLESLLNREALSHLDYIEATVAPSNLASLVLFRRFASRHHSPFHVSSHFGQHLFRSKEHEEERLIRIGPLPPTRHS